MELKYNIEYRELASLLGSNRTFMELKFSCGLLCLLACSF